MQIDVTRPSKLYRYSERKWLERSLELGEFRLRPASDYKSQEVDLARHDDELVRIYRSPANTVTITLESTGHRMRPVGDVVSRDEVGANYLTICFSDRWDERMFNDFPGTDACLVIHCVEEFCERLHAAAELVLPQWGGMDGPVLYGGSSPLGAVFSKPLQFIIQHEWRFAWRPWTPVAHIDSVTVQIGRISGIAEIVDRPLNRYLHI